MHLVQQVASGRMGAGVNGTKLYRHPQVRRRSESCVKPTQRVLMMSLSFCTKRMEMFSSADHSVVMATSVFHWIHVKPGSVNCKKTKKQSAQK